MANKNQSANDARAIAKAKAQQQVKAKERRTTVIIVAVSLVVIAVFAGVVYFIVDSSKQLTLEQMWAMENPPVPAGSDPTGGIPVGTGGVAAQDVPTAGESVPRLDLYIDLLCPVCNQFEQTNGEDINDLREAGTVAVYYHPISILYDRSLGTEYSRRAANAVAVVADQDPEHFLDFIGVLYHNQPEENTAGLTDDEIASLAESVGVPADVAASFRKEQFRKWVIAATNQASIDGMQGTPTVMVNRTVLDQQSVSYFTPGVLKTYLQQVAGGAVGASPSPSPSS